MNRLRISAGIVSLVGALAACSTSQAGSNDVSSNDVPPSGAASPSSSSTAGAPPAAKAPLPVPRGFTCTPSAVTSDTQLLAVGTDKIVVRPSGVACAYHLVVVSPAGEKILSPAPGMIVLASAVAVDANTLVVCFSNEQHSQVAGGGPLDRYSDGVQVQCAVRANGTWSPTLGLPQIVDAASWIADVQPDITNARGIVVRWLRDSKFQFLHLTPDDRPPTDGLYDTHLAISGGQLVLGTTAAVGGPMFQTVPPQ